MPSLHIAWAVWCTLALWRASERRWVRTLALAYPCLTGLAVVATGNHFLLDIVGGLLVLGAAVLLVDAPRRIRGRPALPRIALGRRSARPIASVGPALRMSQTCYEVRDPVE
jgi:membrane-associated phospholipid phosphatase